MKEKEQKKDKKKQSAVSVQEEKTLAFWREHDVFAKSLGKNKEGDERFVFYDGPPFATGLPHYGHIIASIIKDAIPRYETMRGKYVRRIWGWDCHGLPIENLIEKELGLERKSDIEKMGIGKFNTAACASVMRYDNEWKKIIPRIGRWVDMEHGYKTMDWTYTESIWWAFKTLSDKGLIYQGYKSMHICPRCGTTLANAEVAQGYKDITDISVTAKFELADEPGTYVLAWTTTPWTLPGNVALAVGEDIDYVEIAPKKEEGTHYILAKDRLDVFSDEYDVAREFKGKELVGKLYKPLFDYYAKSASLKNQQNGWKIYPADFVTIESGTGVVHIAPAFGEDDMELGKTFNLPFVQHVGMDGVFTPEVVDFAGASVKPKDDHQKTDIAILKFLAGKGALFSKEKITHSYPHCWRCDTPLLNYAASSWFVKVTALKDELLKANNEVRWIPDSIKEGRFGKWLEGARDWAISRTRYWGAPLPVWECNKCKQQKVIGSIDDIKKEFGVRNNFFVMRHGQAESNVAKVVSSQLGSDRGLTEKGRAQASEAGKMIKEKNIDLIIASPFLRTKETAELVAQAVGIDPQKIIFDERLREVNTGKFDGQSVDAYRSFFSTPEERFTKTPPEGENLIDLKRRVTAFLYEVNEKYDGKNILFVTHEYVAWMLFIGACGEGNNFALQEKDRRGEDFLTNAEIMDLPFAPFPHNENYEIDLHKPYIDAVKLPCVCGGEMARVTEVFDCWFESGSMPYAQFHYPFENKDEFKRNFPADFIAEGLDQTRGWFYSMLVLSVGLFGKSAFKNVIVNGMILAEDGQKMSKRLQNYPEVMSVVDRYSADALRAYLLSSPVSHGEELNFSERGVDEVQKKIILRLLNVLSFFELFRDDTVVSSDASDNILDRWIIVRTNELLASVDDAFNTYLLDRAIRSVGEFVDDLSTWYLRRSRLRFKSDDVKEKEAALATLQFVLVETAKIIAPLMPFVAEELYTRVGGSAESVHLENWPQQRAVDKEVLSLMSEVRIFASLALMQRAEAGIKVRQPLQKLSIFYEGGEPKGWDSARGVLADEINVKEIVFVKNTGHDKPRVELDTVITPKLKREGMFRDLTRIIQEERKRKKFIPSDRAILTVATNDAGREFVTEFTDELKRASGIKDIHYSNDDQEQSIDLGGIPLGVSLRTEHE